MQNVLFFAALAELLAFFPSVVALPVFVVEPVFQVELAFAVAQLSEVALVFLAEPDVEVAQPFALPSEAAPVFVVGQLFVANQRLAFQLAQF